MGRISSFPRRELGASLVELIVGAAVVVLAIAVGIPSVDAYVDRGRAAIAVGDIGTISSLLYRWQLNTRTFPETLAQAGLDGRLDPWGHPYRYLKVETAKPEDVRRGRNSQPINSDFDLYSVGPDGQTEIQLTGAKARDDIIRANNGRFFGIAGDY